MHVIDPCFQLEDYFPIDLSTENQFWMQNNITSVSVFEKYLNKKIEETEKRVAYGGFLEQRALYSNSERFQDGEPRDVHLGLDLWAPAGTGVHAILDGKIHSFANNSDPGNYGPTLILEHVWNNKPLFSLNGHLSISDIKNWETGKTYKAGDRIAHLGKPMENGGYAPHLHLQLMLDMENYMGDYPGVASINQVAHYKHNLIDPGVFLGLYKK